MKQIKIIITLLITLVFNVSCSQETKEKPFDIEKIKLTRNEKIKLKKSIEYIDNLTLDEIKKDLKKNLSVLEKLVYTEKEVVFNKDSILEEEYSRPFKLYLENIQKQVEVLKKHTFFFQSFKKDSVYLDFDTKQDYFTNSQKDETVFVDTYKLKKKYLNTKEIDTIFNIEAFFSFDYDDINFGKAKYIDSLLFTADINYITKYDTIVFNKKEILKNKDGILIKEITNNYLHFQNINNIDFFKVEAYNNNGRKLKEKQHAYYSPNTKKSLTKEFLIIGKKTYQNIKNIESHEIAKEEMKKAFYKFALLERKNNSSQYSFMGNIDKIKFYIEKERKNLNFNFIVKDKEPTTTFYLNQLEKETLIMNTKNELIFKIPETNLKYLKYDNLSKKNLFYLYKEKDIGKSQYFYLNPKTKIFKEIKNVNMRALTGKLVETEIIENDFIYAIYNSKGENVSGYKYTDIEVRKDNNKYIIKAEKEDKTSTLINEEGKEIEPKK